MFFSLQFLFIVYKSKCKMYSIPIDMLFWITYNLVWCTFSIKSDGQTQHFCFLLFFFCSFFFSILWKSNLQSVDESMKNSIDLLFSHACNSFKLFCSINDCYSFCCLFIFQASIPYNREWCQWEIETYSF